MITWFDNRITGGSDGHVLDGMVVISVYPVYHIKDQQGKFELLIGQRYFSRDKLSKGDAGYFYTSLDAAKVGAGRVMVAMVKKLAGEIKG